MKETHTDHKPETQPRRKDVRILNKKTAQDCNTFWAVNRIQLLQPYGP